MVVHNEADRYLQRVLEHAATYVDDFVIIDDASDDMTAEVCRAAVGGKQLKLIHNQTSEFANEIQLRKHQWDATIETSPDWILFLDADEIFEDRVRDGIRPLIDQNSSDLVLFRLYDMWDEHHYREDGHWRAHTLFRPILLRHRPDFDFRWQETAQHCGRMPENALELPRTLSSLRIKHYGWARLADRRAKYDRYMRLDPEGKFGIPAQYQSILDEHPHLLEWTD